MSILYTGNFDSGTDNSLASGWAGLWLVTSAKTLFNISGSKCMAPLGQSPGAFGGYNGIAARTQAIYQLECKANFSGANLILPGFGHGDGPGSWNTFYYRTYLTGDASGLSVSLDPYVGGGFPGVVASGAFTGAIATGDIISIKIKIDGINYSVWVWNSTTGPIPTTPTLTWTDSTQRPAGYLTLISQASGEAGVDNVTISDLATGATAVTMTGPTSGTAGVASTNFTIGADDVITGTVVVTPSDGGAGGTFTPTTVSISSGTPTATFTYTPSSTGAKTISVTNNGGLTNPSNITYTASSGATVPGAPTIGPATAGNASASVTFTPPGSNGGSAITGYTVTSSPGGFTGTGAASPVVVSGLTNGTAYTFTVHATNAVGNSAESGASNSVTPAAPAMDTTKILFSPYNWNVLSGSAKTINAGAYFKVKFSGASCTLNFDLTSVSSPVPKIAYRVDGILGFTEVDIASSVVISMPSVTTDYPLHLLEVYVKSTSAATNRWGGSNNVVNLSGISLAIGGVLSKPTELPLRALYFGDSITEGNVSLNAGGDNTLQSNAMQSWSLESAKILGAEIGNVGFGGQGWLAYGAGSVPDFGSTYDKLYSGVTRSLSIEPDFIVINHGTNDAADVTAAATAVLNSLLAATTSTAIIVMRPFNGARSSEIQAAIAASSNPSRIKYIDTTGWFVTANSADGLHPNGFESITNLSHRTADAIRSIVHPLRGRRSAKTITLSLVDSSGSPRASLSGLKWAFFDQATPNALTVAADQGAGETTDGSGNLVITVLTTLSAGQVGWLIVSDSDGTTTQSPAHKAFSGPVLVS